MKLTKEEFARMFDHTYLKPYASEDDMDRLCEEAIKVHAAMVAINSCQVEYCKKKLAGSDIHVGAAISFPLGQTTIETKAFETEDAIKKGADEIDYVVNLTKVKMKDWDYVQKEMETIVSICRKNQVISKVIFENCYLEEDEKIKLCEIARAVEPDYIKTSTGFGSGGATVEDVQLMKKNVGDKVKVKAAGGIRDLKTALAMVNAGASRIGASATLKILEEFEHENTL